MTKNKVATNTVRTVQNQKEENVLKSKPKLKSNSIFKSLDHLRINKIFEDGLPVRHLPKILYVCIFLVVYIGNSHYAERTVRNISKIKTEVDDLRADYTTLKAELMYASKQSEVAKRVSYIGLEESSQPPYKLKLEGEY